MKRNIFEQILLYNYRYPIAHLIIIGFGFYSFFWCLDDLLPGLTRFEATYLDTFSLTDLSLIWQNPINWLHKLVTIGVNKLMEPSFAALRVPSTLFAIAASILFYINIKDRFKTRIAIIAVFLLVTSSWWLTLARSARPEILAPLLILLLIFIAQKAYVNSSGWLVLATSLVVAIAIYTPLMIYVVAIGLFVLRPLILKMTRTIANWWFWLALIILISGSLPLFIAGAKDITVWYQILGLPSEGTVNVLSSLQGIRDTLGQLFWSSQPFWDFRLGNLPLLDLFTAVMFILGIYHLDHEISRSLTKFTLIGFGALLVLSNLNPTPGHEALLLPFVYILVAAGVVVLYAQWYHIFPRNPIARMVALIPSVLLIISVSLYHHQRFFVAWPSAPDILQSAPPFTRSLMQHYQSVGTQNNQAFPRIVIVADDEVVLARAATMLWSSPPAVSSVSSIGEGQQGVIYSNAAYNQLDDAIKKGLTAVPTSYSSSPVGVWYR